MASADVEAAEDPLYIYVEEDESTAELMIDEYLRKNEGLAIAILEYEEIPDDIYLRFDISYENAPELAFLVDTLESAADDDGVATERVIKITSWYIINITPEHEARASVLELINKLRSGLLGATQDIPRYRRRRPIRVAYQRRRRGRASARGSRSMTRSSASGSAGRKSCTRDFWNLGSNERTPSGGGAVSKRIVLALVLLSGAERRGTRHRVRPLPCADHRDQRLSVHSRS